MPQLDKVTFISQFFWLFIVFGSFYLYVWKSLLPKISQIFKVRQKKINSNNEGFTIFKEEEKSITNNYDQILANALLSSQKLFINTSNYSTNWLTDSIKATNQNTLLNLNEKYIAVLGDLSGKKYLIENYIHQA